MPRFFSTAALLILLFSIQAAAEQAVVAVAANFTKPMQAIVEAFEKSHAHTVRLSSGSSGKLFAQIEHGAPFDLFLSADTAKPKKLIASGKAFADSRFTYAIGRLVLWETNGGPARQRLEQGDYRRLAMANPRLAPYGLAAKQTLEKLGRSIGDKLVTGENITQAYGFVASGNAELGFVAFSQIVDNGKLPDGAWLVPGTFHTPIRQDAVLLERGRTNEAAKALLKFLQSGTAIAIIRQYGYDVEPPPR